MFDVRQVEVASLSERWVEGGVEDVRGAAMIVCAPFVEMVGDIKGGWVGAGVFKVHDDDLYNI